VHIGIDRFAKVGNFVDKSDLGGEKGVRSVLYHLGGAPGCKYDGRLDEVENPVQLPHDVPSPLDVGTDDNPVRSHEVVDR
jgi:hypothetical protein